MAINKLTDLHVYQNDDGLLCLKFPNDPSPELTLRLKNGMRVKEFYTAPSGRLVFVLQGTKRTPGVSGQ